MESERESILNNDNIEYNQENFTLIKNAMSKFSEELDA